MDTNKTDNLQIEKGYTRIPNDILEGLCKINLSPYQARVIYYIFRKTYGYNKNEDWISVNQIAKEIGIRQSHASRTKKELLLRRILTSNGIKIAFQKDSSLWRNIPVQVCEKNIPVQVIHIPIQDKNIPVPILNIPVEGDTIDTIQKTITKNTLQKKYSSLADIDLPVLEEIAQKYHVPPSFVQSKLDDMSNWMAAHGKTYKDYKAALMSWVKSDALKIIQKERQIVNKYSVTKV